MAQRNFFVLLAITSLFSGATVLVVHGQVYTANYPYCSTTDNYTMASAYQVNLAKVMSDLPQGAINNRGFYTSMAGEAPDQVFGLSMCYADRNWTQCQNCLWAAAAGVQQTCPFSREMKACYDAACVLRYSNVPFFSVADPTIALYMILRNSVVSDVAGMIAARQKLLSQLAREAAASTQLLGLANGSLGYTDSLGDRQVMYGLTQCTRDLNASECSRCLTKTVDKLSSSFPNDTYGAVKAYSCYVVYSVGGNFLSISIPPAAPSPPPESKTTLPAPPTISRNKKALLAGVLVASFLVLFICIGTLVWVLHCRRHSPNAMQKEQELYMFNEDPQVLDMSNDELYQGNVPRRFKYSELAVATDGFNDKEKLGEGGFGSVYRGYLKGMNLHVAIKRVSKRSWQGKKEFESEVKIISRLRHRNLVQLIGWCHDGGELLLVYEHLPNRSLDTHIPSRSKVLSWPVRKDIILGIGSALQYLHHDWEQCVLHRDIKPSNVMLDASFNAKLGDFGLARLVDHGDRSRTTVLAGTMGYMDTECFQTGRYSTESDVYSFGVLVLEIICGRPPIMPPQETGDSHIHHLVQWVWELYGHGRIMDAADVQLNGEFDGLEFERVMVTALWCTHPDRTLRLSIRQATNILRLETPLPHLPAKMPVATFMAPVESVLSESVTDSSSSTGLSMTNEISSLLR